MKIIKRILITLICIPLLTIFAFIAFEIFGLSVNHYATSQQTNSLKETILSVAPDAEILDAYSETGNTSGTGNHVDMLSVVLIKTNIELSKLKSDLNEHYKLDSWSFWIEETGSYKLWHDENSLSNFFDKLAVPKEMYNTYIVYLCQSAPFADNIQGH